jgi:hypothetical protein
MTLTTAAAVTRAPMMRSPMMIDATTMKVPMPRDVQRKRFQELNAWTKLQPALPQHTSPKSIPSHLAPRFLIPSGARGPTSRLFVELPAAPSGGENIVGLPTPSSDYASTSGQCGDIVTSKKRRDRVASDDGREYHKRRVTERRRPRDIDDGTTPQALPTNPPTSARVFVHGLRLRWRCQFRTLWQHQVAAPSRTLLTWIVPRKKASIRGQGGDHRPRHARSLHPAPTPL